MYDQNDTREINTNIETCVSALLIIQKRLIKYNAEKLLKMLGTLDIFGEDIKITYKETC